MIYTPNMKRIMFINTKNNSYYISFGLIRTILTVMNDCKIMKILKIKKK